MILVKNIRKEYNSEIVLEDLSFSLKKGECLCVGGKNGAGKTTLIKLLAGVIPLTLGEIQYFGKRLDLDQDMLLKKIGVAIDENHLIQELTAQEYLNLVSSFYDVPPSQILPRIKDLCRCISFDFNNLSRPIGALSYGSKKKLLLFSSLIHNPDILILDEPFNGLDQISIHQVSLLLKSIKKEKIILLSSHHSDHLEDICDYLATLDKGRFDYFGKFTSRLLISHTTIKDSSSSIIHETITWLR